MLGFKKLEARPFRKVPRAFEPALRVGPPLSYSVIQSVKMYAETFLSGDKVAEAWRRMADAYFGSFESEIYGMGDSPQERSRGGRTTYRANGANWEEKKDKPKIELLTFLF